MKNKLLTIAVPTYNRVEKLKICLEKIINQITDDVEILVSDNYSYDGTEEFMRQYETNHPTILYYRNSENIGPDRNFLNCYEKSIGEYVWLIGDDDYLLPGAVNSVLKLLQDRPIFMHLNSCGLKSEVSFICSKSRFENTNEMIFSDKNEFLSKIGIYITFLSSLILKTELVRQIENKEQYIGTNFIQSHIALRTLGTDGKYIINTYNCLAASPNETVNYDLYYVWFECFYKLLMKTGVKSGFCKEILSNVYHDNTDRTVRYFVLQFRATCGDKAEKWNKKCIDSCLEDYPDLQRLFKRIVNCPVGHLRYWKLFYRIKGKLERK